ncbi:iron-containing redox enzyme family protein [Kibdelosporangium aridum]|uniref:iron-containing redox enzyme family protein n=1 Tax=Kibdelosporangium aridum TaxID=2030 RepID=UPI000525446A
MKLPEPRGDLSAAVIDLLGGTSKALPEVDHDPYGEDLQLALHTAYELHYRGFPDVDPEWEWDPDLLRLRRDMEKAFLAALREDVPGGDDISGVLAQLLVEPVDGEGVSHFLKDDGEWWQIREYFVHRSIYHHKEADPHIWVVPRLQGRAKAALVAVEFDEFGGGRAERLHSQLYVDLLAGAGLETGYLHYLDDVPAQMLAVVNMMSLFGLHRAFRGALVGHFAAAEITTAPSAQRMVKALSRFDADEACLHFYTEHMEADAVHEQVMRRDVIGDLLDREPELTESVVFGVQATELLEERFGEHVLSSWRAGQSSLRRRTT